MFRSNSVLHPPSSLLTRLALCARVGLLSTSTLQGSHRLRAQAAPHGDQHYCSCTTQCWGPGIPGISWNLNWGQHIAGLCFSAFLAAFWFSLRWFCMADIFPYKHLPEQNFGFSGLHTRLLFQALYLSVLDGRLTSDFQKKKSGH